MEIGKEESNVQNAQLSMQELYGKTQEPPHKKVPLTENMQYSDRERIHAYWLSRVDGIGAVTAAKLYESCGSFRESMSGFYIIGRNWIRLYVPFSERL